jgi:predicted alpha/beta hydrolase family esterase
MARSSILDFRVLVVPGLHGSGPAHWQTRWQRLYPYFERVEQQQWDVPDLEAWTERFDQVVRQSSQPALVVAHSFGCLAAVHRIGTDASTVSGALLVAPADPGKFGIARKLQNARLPVPALLVASSTDPWMDIDGAVLWASRWRSDFVNVGALGHVNADSRLGDWQQGLGLLRQLAATIPARSYPKAVCQSGAVRNLFKISI